MRGCLAPAVVALLTSDMASRMHWALFLMIVAEISDFIDGFIARRFNQQTEIGRFIDPIADSIYHLSVFLAFLSLGWMPAWMLFVIYARDLAVPYIRAFARQSGKDLENRMSGKVKSATHALAQVGVVAIALGAFGPANGVDGVLSHGLLLAATAMSLYSLLDYALEAKRLVADK
ncbi:MAG: CDP-diacylglycerol--glycerol-3-phosphate 3-phosphatidyltransferase [Hyphomicrobiaceae bacterium]